VFTAVMMSIPAAGVTGLWLAHRRLVQPSGEKLNRLAWEATFRERGLPVPPGGPRDGFWGARMPPWTPDPELGWREAEAHLPGLVEEDASGVQRLERPDARRHLLILGGSVAWGAYASSLETTYFARLARWLAQRQCPVRITVLAAGAWTPALATSLGIDIPLQPAKGYSCTIDAFPGSPTMPVFVPGRRVAITPIGDRLRFGGTLELAGFADTLDATRYRAVIEAARLVLGDRLQMKNEEAWFGYRPVTPDGLPVIARAPGIDGLIVAAGHAMLGFTQSPATGKLVAELANGQTPSVPLEPFRLDRF